MARRGAKKPAGLILFHGAGGNREHHLFLALEEALNEELDLPVARINFPYRQKNPGRSFPDRMPTLLVAVNEAMTEAAAEWGVDPGRILLGGRSMGGRAASMAVAEGLSAAGLLLLSYPLHPPGKPDKLRVDHFGAVTCPALLVQGERDPFGTPSEFAEHLPALAGELTEFWIDANHDPKPALDAEIVKTVQSWLTGSSWG